MQNVQLIESLQKCIRECLNCADSCLDEDNIKKMVPCVRLDRACAETCQAGANLLAINATNAREMVQLCKDICSKCADECEYFDFCGGGSPASKFYENNKLCN